MKDKNGNEYMVGDVLEWFYGCPNPQNKKGPLRRVEGFSSEMVLASELRGHGEYTGNFGIDKERHEIIRRADGTDPRQSKPDDASLSVGPPPKQVSGHWFGGLSMLCLDCGMRMSEFANSGKQCPTPRANEPKAAQSPVGIEAWLPKIEPLAPGIGDGIRRCLPNATEEQIQAINEAGKRLAASVRPARDYQPKEDADAYDIRVCPPGTTLTESTKRPEESPPDLPAVVTKFWWQDEDPKHDVLRFEPGVAVVYDHVLTPEEMRSRYDQVMGQAHRKPAALDLPARYALFRETVERVVREEAPAARVVTDIAGRECVAWFECAGTRLDATMHANMASVGFVEEWTKDMLVDLEFSLGARAMGKR